MARAIIVTLNGRESRFDLEKLQREKLYGKRRRVATDPTGQPCTRASLTADGRLLIVSGMTSQGYFDDAGRWIPNAELVGLDADKQPLPLRPSTLGVAQPLRGPVQATEVLDHQVSSVYMLSPQDFDPDLEKQLATGAIFAFSFNYRSDFREELAYLVQNDNGVFALVGQPALAQWSNHEVVADVAAGDAEEDEDLDFEMF